MEGVLRRTFRFIEMIIVMEHTFEKISILAKKYLLFIVLCCIVLVLLLILLFAGEKIQEDTWSRNFISALLGAATVSVITYLLLKGQANNESAVEQNKKVFENRLNAYESFLSILQNVVVNNVVDEKSEKLLQFGIATIGMHADSEDMLVISKNLKYILQKIKVKERADGSIWNELMEIVNVFHHSLYVNKERKVDSCMRKSLRNFSGLCVDENYEILQFVECLLSSFHFDSFIAGQCLFYSIPVKKYYVKNRNVPRKLYVTLRIDKITDDMHYSGIIAIYSESANYEQLREMMKSPDLWIGSDKITFIEKSELGLGINVVDKAFVLSFEKKKDMELQSAVCDVFMFMHPIWAEKGVSYLRKDKDGRLIREIPSSKLPLTS